jgi:hypothetical protein
MNIMFTISLSHSLFLGTNLKFDCKKEPKIQPTQASQRNPNEFQETMLIYDLSFHVTTKFLHPIHYQTKDSHVHEMIIHVSPIKFIIC